MSKLERPIKVIKTFAKDFNDKSYGFGEKEPIRPVTKELMARLKSEVRQVSEHFRDSRRQRVAPYISQSLTKLNPTYVIK